MSQPPSSEQQALARHWTLLWLESQENQRPPFSVVPGRCQENGGAGVTGDPDASEKDKDKGDGSKGDGATKP